MAFAELAKKKEILRILFNDSGLDLIILFTRLIAIFLLISLFHPIRAQTGSIDSLQLVIRQHAIRDTTWIRLQSELMKGNTSKGYYKDNYKLAMECLPVADSLGDVRGKLLALMELTTSRYYLGLPDTTSLKYTFQAKELAERNHFMAEWIQLTTWEASYYLRLGETRKCLETAFKARSMALKIKDQLGFGLTSHLLGNVYFNVFSDYNTALKYYLESISSGRPRLGVLTNIGRVFETLKEYDKAQSYYNQALNESLKTGKKWPELLALRDKGHLFLTLKKYDSAELMYSRSLGMAQILGIRFAEAQCQHGLASLYLQNQNYEEAMAALQRAEKIILKLGSTRELIGYYADMAEIRHHQGRKAEEKQYLLKALQAEPQRDKKNYLKVLISLVALSERAGNLKEALNYQRQVSVLQDSSFNEQKVREAMRLEANFQLESSKREIDSLAAQNQQKETLIQQRTLTRNIMIALSSLLTLAILVIYYAYHINRISKIKLEGKNHIIEKQKEELSASLADLHRMKGQLVMSEKMASLGQVAAGIAHEINNPLNFISGGVEGMSVIQGEITSFFKKKGPAEIKELEELEEERKTLLTSVQNGIERITKIIGSLKAFSSPQIHERSCVLVQELIDITYTLLRAKLTQFQIQFAVKDETSGEMVFANPTEISQVLVNLIDNAISILEDRPAPRMITLETLNHPTIVEIRVSDNGLGIPEEIRHHIMEPFFTTKPPGKGTGLGLYMSYGIVKKHHGSLTFESGSQGTTFILRLKKQDEN